MLNYRRKKNRRIPTSLSISSSAQNDRFPDMAPGVQVLGGFPPRKSATLKYVEFITLDPAAGSIAAHEFSMRNLYDPDVTGSGHQPSNFDRWTVIYNRWTVLRTRVKMSPAWNSTSSVAPGMWGFLISSRGSQVSGLNSVSLAEQPYVKYSTAPPTISNGLGSALELKASLRSAPWLGVRPDLLFSSDYTGDDISGPSAINDYRCEFFVSAIAGNDPGAAIFRIELEYDAVFIEPKLTLPS